MLFEFSATPFHLSHQGLNDRDVQLALSEVFSSLTPELYFRAPHLHGGGGGGGLNLVPNRVGTTAHESFKIGFISSHFFEHSIGRILVGLIDRMSDTLIQSEALSGNRICKFFFLHPHVIG